MKELIFVLAMIYLPMLIGSLIGLCITRENFIRPKGLWILVPFRLGGFRSSYDDKIYDKNWVWQRIDFSNPKKP